MRLLRGLLAFKDFLSSMTAFSRRSPKSNFVAKNKLIKNFPTFEKCNCGHSEIDLCQSLGLIEQVSVSVLARLDVPAVRNAIQDSSLKIPSM
jgi:hypothetical protein